MIIVNINGPLHRQLGQLAFGIACARVLQTKLKVDGNPVIGEYFNLGVPLATPEEVAAAKANAVVTDHVFNPVVADGIYLDGAWIDYRYHENARGPLVENLALRREPHAETRALLDAIQAAGAASVSIDLRARADEPGVLPPPAIYYEDAIAEMKERVPNAHFFLFCDSADDMRAQLALDGSFTIIEHANQLPEAEALMLLSACHHHVVTYGAMSYWAARLDPKQGGIVVAPQLVFDPASGKQQPVWPPHWFVFPNRLVRPLLDRNPALDFKGGTSLKRRMRVGMHSLYERNTTDGFLFKNVQTTNGHNLLKPFVDLYEYGKENGIDFYTLDQVSGMDQLDAVVFTDRPKPENALANAALASPHLVKILVIYECPLIKPDGWDTEYHKQFDYVFTWGDNLVDGIRYIKNNFVNDLELPYDFEVLKSAFEQRKLATLINSAVLLETPNQFPTELYTHRIRTIRWFEANARQDFDLYGMGWNVEMFPSYRGKVRDKLAALSHYRFCICYENASTYEGYITEKIQDCLLAGTVPVYGGAPNIAQWVPADCYIDITQFSSYEELYQHLKNMDAATHAGYLDRIHRFLTTRQAFPFSSECWVTTLTEYLAWKVQTRRGDVPDLAQRRGVTANADTHDLVQDKRTLELAIVPKQAAAMPHAAASPVTIRAALAQLERPDLIVYLSYGPEMTCYLRARALWDFYAAHFPRLKVFFIRDSDDVPKGQIVEDGRDLVFGTGQERHTERGAAFTADGAWSAEHNERLIWRQVSFYDYLNRKYDHDFLLYYSTITSVVDVRGLIALMDVLPKRGLFAGMPGTLQHAPYQGTGMVHGANTMISRDVMNLMRTRFTPGHEFTKQPNDHWQGLILPDVPRTALPLFSFNKARDVGEDLSDIRRLVANLVRDGHYHFRIKTTSQEEGRGRREDVDPWMMLQAMEAILSTEASVDAVRSLQQRFAAACDPVSQVPRDFPVDDSETQFFYR